MKRKSCHFLKPGRTNYITSKPRDGHSNTQNVTGNRHVTVENMGFGVTLTYNRSVTYPNPYPK